MPKARTIGQKEGAGISTALRVDAVERLFHFSGSLPDDVNDREYNHPDDVDEMPVPGEEKDSPELGVHRKTHHRQGKNEHQKVRPTITWLACNPTSE